MKTNGNIPEEGKVAETLENVTSRIPSDVYLWAGLGSLAASLGLLISNKKHLSLYVGLWAPAFLIMGLYNKIVKVAGHDAEDKEQKKAQMRRNPVTA